MKYMYSMLSAMHRCNSAAVNFLRVHKTHYRTENSSIRVTFTTNSCSGFYYSKFLLFAKTSFIFTTWSSSAAGCSRLVFYNNKI